MNYLVRAPIGPNNNYQWIPCDTIQEATLVAKIVCHGEKPLIYDLSTGKNILS